MDFTDIGTGGTESAVRTGPLGECLVRTPALSTAAPRIRGIVVPPPSLRLVSDVDDEDITAPMADVATPTLEGIATVLGVGTAMKPPPIEMKSPSIEPGAKESYPPSFVTPSPPLRELPPVEPWTPAHPVVLASSATGLDWRARIKRAASALLGWLTRLATRAAAVT